MPKKSSRLILFEKTLAQSLGYILLKLYYKTAAIGQNLGNSRIIDQVIAYSVMTVVDICSVAGRFQDFSTLMNILIGIFDYKIWSWAYF